MGGDGGSTTTDRRFVGGLKGAGTKGERGTYKDNGSHAMRQRERVSECAQSGKPLGEAVMACEMGNLFDKEEVLSALLDKVRRAVLLNSDQAPQ
jgi:hypothetical protein